ncbi:hypothetical protein [Kitasatospora sp. NPDC002040]|uniref:hypothetical protein n=1 Tax=Kitasatospora sp. NPDC002040 TaxID=3154661 RepID=UPI003327C7F6
MTGRWQARTVGRGETMLREESGTVLVAVPDGRQRRHGRQKPVGARFRLPGFRFSGAAMAMSTVVGISVATTWLVSEQQNVGRLPGVSNVGASPPVPSPDSAAQAIASTSAVPAVPAASASPSGQATRSTPPAAKPVTAPPSPPRGAAPSAPTVEAPVAVASSPAPGSAAPTAPAATPSSSPTAPASPIAAAPPAAKQPASAAPDLLTGTAERRPLGPSGTRHTLELTVTAPVTALQVEFRLERPAALPGTLPWSNVPGAVVTVLQERGTVVYRFTLAPGLDVGPGAYVFAVHGAGTAPDRSEVRKDRAAVEESWTASAFGLLDRPHAVAVRGLFG